MSAPKCYACSCRQRPGDFAFIAGIAFIYSHNSDAQRRLLCDMHRELMLDAERVARVVIKPEDRREVKS